MPASTDVHEAPRPHPLSHEVLQGGLYADEFFWRDHQPWLADSGYMLRPRYRQDWEPSWLKTKKDPLFCEDGKGTLRVKVMDAVRTSDGRVVVLKQVKKSYTPDEEEMNRLFTQSADSQNHVAPVYEVLQSPLDEDIIFLVMPYLVRINTVKFATIGEVVECLRQLFEGLCFMHRNHVAHCDIHVNNILMDPVPLFSELPHPVRLYKSYDFKRRVTQHTRTAHPTTYYYIDLGLSNRCDPPGASPLIHVSIGGDRTVPEYKDPSALRDPYKIDVYCLGNVIREEFLEEHDCFDFFKPLVVEMMQIDPGQRPSAEEAFARFEQLRASLTERTLRSRVIARGEFKVAGLYRACRHAFRTLYWFATGTPALPAPHGSL
ncbi:kinase-like domain-containing protein [Dichomitus squalens]|uniref:Kinase-like domain-containing protein n=1 Tax=Dichomitus squalens TaxID=114155 RepID=A0A4Q9MUQ0_9APHY|nr:kinase-like domain-containing protein [Dichomitus squalens]